MRGNQTHRRPDGEVRRATASDVSVLVGLTDAVQMLHAQLYPEQFKTSAEPNEAATFFSNIIKSENNSIGIFQGSEGALGYIWVEQIERPQTPFTRASCRMHIHHLSVTKDAQRQGIGGALMAWAVDEAHASALLQITVEHWAANEAAGRFFRRHGFKDLRIVLHRLTEASRS